jgi:mono/diheme cytochrome c family protein
MVNAGWRSELSARVAQAEDSVLRGVFTKDQAKRGEQDYDKACASCHLADLSGQQMAPALAGDAFIQNYDGLNVGDLFERIQTTMPQNAAGSLSNETYVDIVAFLLQANGFPAGTQPLSSSLDALRSIVVKRKPSNP